MLGEGTAQGRGAAGGQQRKKDRSRSIENRRQLCAD